MDHKPLIACHECDALFREPQLHGKSSAHCLHCGAILYRSPARWLDGICALTLAALFTFLIAQGFSILKLQTAGITLQTSLFGAPGALWNEDMQIVAAIVIVLLDCAFSVH